MPAMMLTGEYRYVVLDDPEFDGTEAEIAGHKISVGLRYKF